MTPGAGADTQLTQLEWRASAGCLDVFAEMNDPYLQRREMKVSLGPCKGKDFANTMGPWIVTADEFEDRHDAEGFLPISMSASVNGEQIGQDLLSNMGWPFAELVAYASQDSW